MSLKTDFKDDIFDGKRKYNLITNEDGTVSFEDVTEYVQEGDLFGGNEINTTNLKVNELEGKQIGTLVGAYKLIEEANDFTIYGLDFLADGEIYQCYLSGRIMTNGIRSGVSIRFNNDYTITNFSESRIVNENGTNITIVSSGNRNFSLIAITENYFSCDFTITKMFGEVYCVKSTFSNTPHSNGNSYSGLLFGTQYITSKNINSITISNHDGYSFIEGTTLEIYKTGRTTEYTEITGGRACFTGETLVSTENGLKMIQDIEIGDKVYSKNSENQIELKLVDKLVTHETNQIYKIDIDKEIINSTWSHPFFVKDKYIIAKDLKIGDELINMAGETTVIKNIEITEVEPTTVYEIRVVNNNNYFVGDSQILVANEESVINS